MEGAYYLIHDLLEIHASPRVSQDIVRMLDFQLGSLRTIRSEHSADYKIIIKPYDEFEFESGATVVNLWRASGVTGCSFNYPEERLALKKGEDSLAIYADSRRFPINMFIQFILMDRGVSLLPAAAIVDEANQATLLAGAGGAGKTVITLSAVKNNKYRLLGDDTICVDNSGYGLSYPREFNLKHYHRSTFPEYFSVSAPSGERKSSSFKKIFIKQVIRNMPFLGFADALLYKLGRPGLWNKLKQDVMLDTRNANNRKAYGAIHAVPVESIYGENKIAPKANFVRVVYLERYNGDSFAITPMHPDVLADRLCALLHNEWALSARRLYLISVLELVNLNEFFSRSREIIYASIKNSQCERLLIPSSCTPEALSRYYLSQYPA